MAFSNTISTTGKEDKPHQHVDKARVYLGSCYKGYSHVDKRVKKELQ